MSKIRTVAKGELLFKEGDRAMGIIMIQSGAVQLSIIRPKKNIELMQVSTGQILGEQALSGGVYPYTGLAVLETKVIELPSELYKQQVESSPQIVKAVIKSLTDRMKVAFSDLRTFRMEKDSSPCPDEQVAKVFGSVFHSARYKGVSDPKETHLVTVDWQLFRQYSQRVFGESLRRLENATNIIVKLGAAKYEMGKSPEDPDGPDQILSVQFNDLPMVESFFEFFQHYYFKGGRGEVLRFDETSTKFLKKLIDIGQDLIPDRNGLVSTEYIKVIEAFKADLGVNLNTDHFNRLETKGVFVKRQPRSDGTVWATFDLKEFHVQAKIFAILKEVEKWNDKGFVDMNEDDRNAKKAGGPSCPECAADIAPLAKFCQHCGHKLAASSAA